VAFEENANSLRTREFFFSSSTWTYNTTHTRTALANRDTYVGEKIVVNERDNNITRWRRRYHGGNHTFITCRVLYYYCRVDSHIIYVYVRACVSCTKCISTIYDLTHATIIWSRLEKATTVVGTHFSGFDRFIL